MEASQNEWLERNKKILAGISLFSSPERIENLAVENLELEHIDYKNVIKITGPGGNALMEGKGY